MSKKRITTIRKAEVSWRDCLEAFLRLKQAQGKAEVTLADYKRHVETLFVKYEANLFSEENLREKVYVYLSQEGIKPATYNSRLVYLKAFMQYCVDEETITKNPLHGFKKRKDEGRIVNIDHKALRKLLDLPDKRTYVGLRDYAVILLTLDCGIRPKEAFSLIPADFNAQNREIVVTAQKAKTRTTRVLPLSIQTVKAIKHLMSARHPEWSKDVPIFSSWEGNQLNRHTWGDRMERYSLELGVKIRPYDLRHAFSLNFLRNGASVFSLQKALGHTDLTMTKRYIALTNDDLKKEHESATPINSLVPEIKRVGKVKVKS